MNCEYVMLLAARRSTAAAGRRRAPRRRRGGSRSSSFGMPERFGRAPAGAVARAVAGAAIAIAATAGRRRRRRRREIAHGDHARAASAWSSASTASADAGEHSVRKDAGEHSVATPVSTPGADGTIVAADATPVLPAGMRRTSGGHAHLPLRHAGGVDRRPDRRARAARLRPVRASRRAAAAAPRLAPRRSPTCARHRRLRRLTRRPAIGRRQPSYARPASETPRSTSVPIAFVVSSIAGVGIAARRRPTAPPRARTTPDPPLWLIAVLQVPLWVVLVGGTVIIVEAQGHRSTSRRTTGCAFEPATVVGSRSACSSQLVFVPLLYLPIFWIFGRHVDRLAGREGPHRPGQRCRRGAARRAGRGRRADRRGAVLPRASPAGAGAHERQGVGPRGSRPCCSEPATSSRSQTPALVLFGLVAGYLRAAHRPARDVDLRPHRVQRRDDRGVARAAVRGS